MNVKQTRVSNVTDVLDTEIQTDDVRIFMLHLLRLIYTGVRIVWSMERPDYLLEFYANIRVVATTPRKDPQPNISDLRDHSQSIFRPILTRVPKKKKKKKKVATPIY